MPRRDRTFTDCDAIRFTLRNLSKKEEDLLEYYYELRFYIKNTKLLESFVVLIDIIKQVVDLILLVYKALVPIGFLKIILGIIQAIFDNIVRLLLLVIDSIVFVIDTRLTLIIAIAHSSGCPAFIELANSGLVKNLQEKVTDLSRAANVIRDQIRDIREKLKQQGDEE
jgi:hypothetical protein